MLPKMKVCVMKRTPVSRSGDTAPGRLNLAPQVFVKAIHHPLVSLEQLQVITLRQKTRDAHQSRHFHAE